MHICEADRLILRRLSLDDVPALAEILSDPDVMKYSVRGVCDEAATHKFIEWCLACYDSHGVGPWALIDKTSSELIGFCGVGPEWVDDVEEVNLGYRLASRYWNKGLASEAARSVLDYVFGKGLFSSVVVIIEPEHAASLKVAEKVGFSRFDAVEFHGRPVRLYRLTSEQWGASHNNAIHVTRA
ncbi:MULTISPECIES: GNAT family N-acetyltransferase [unclassified Pseudoalteromonas]|uniref:GNAT family N-acetyltransferase n=1 Tax=unclassified Pseudoalteromonas TaxID=194690 RepID=UPI002359DD4A|nr:MULTISPECIES: GNAT family N-acetyltransferase [unclassified Pseudoalteromonas]MDC9575651.1 GNAT family N-acetyltransferase [Pseudoalteromonas sp. GABNS16A]MDC9611659.1 GNAT family N-acetyltransferase [Pseudoalteromonas sp. GABNS16H]